MKRIFILLLLAVIFSLGFTQKSETVSWKLKINKVNEKTYTLIATANIAKGFKLYGTHLKDGGPICTSINFETIKNAKLVGNFKESAPPEKTFDSIFNMNISYYRNTATFYQTIECKSKGSTIKGYIQWMSCNGILCTAPKKEHFEFYIE